MLYQKFKKDVKWKSIPGKQLVQNRYKVGKETALKFIKRLKEEREQDGKSVGRGIGVGD